MTRKLSLIMLLVVIITLLFTGCRITYNLNIKTFKEFKKNILKENDKIQKIKAIYYAPALEITYILKNDATDKDVDYIFKKTKQLIADANFQKEFFEVYFARHKSSIIYYPT